MFLDAEVYEDVVIPASNDTRLVNEASALQEGCF